MTKNKIDDEKKADRLSGLSYTDLSGSLTGYEEERIEEKFKFAFDRLINISFTKAGRALLYTHFVRGGASEGEAWKRVMKMTIREVNDAFTSEDEDADDPDPNDPETDQGKPDSPVE